MAAGCPEQTSTRVSNIHRRQTFGNHKYSIISKSLSCTAKRITDDPKDAFWLAQVHFSTGNYTRAQSFLINHKLVDHSPACQYLAAYCHIKQFKFEDALTVLGEWNPTHLITASNKNRRKLKYSSSYPHSGLGKNGKTSKKLDRAERDEERSKEDASDIKFEAAMCYLRGICYAKQNSFDRARECYKDAVRIDVQCFEAFDQLMKNSLLSPDEEWAFLESLDFDSMSSTEPSTAQEAAQFVKMLYTTRLSKYKNPAEFTNATETLSTHYHLSQNHDLLLAKADLLFTQCRFKDALAVTSSILESDEYNFAIYPVHLACLHELGQTNALFLLSHRLADLHPEEPATWLAVGVYYLSTSKISDARRYFSKASMMNPHFGPAWIGFAHTFAAEGEHDQAISAYSTAVRLFQGTHLPQLFLGMQNLQLNNMALAQEYLLTAHELCSTDPLLLNELGVVFYHLDRLDTALHFFGKALDHAVEVDADPKAWIATRANLGHVYRRQGHWEAALSQFNEVLRQGGKDCGMFCAKGLVLLEIGQPWEAVCTFHEALGVQAQDPVATDLLGRALEELARVSKVGGGLAGQESSNDDQVESEFMDFIGQKKKAAKGAMRRVADRRRDKKAADGSKCKGRMSIVSGRTEAVDDSMMSTSADEG